MIHQRRKRGRGLRRKQCRSLLSTPRQGKVLQVRQSRLKRDWGVFCPGAGTPMLCKPTKDGALGAARAELAGKGGEIQMLNYAGDVVERVWVFR